MLTGFMGVGKTTIGQQIAERMNREFLDVDHEIVKRQGMPVTEIFSTLGEKKFREIERELIAEWCRNTRSKVISLGGGAFLQEEVRHACLSTSLVVHLALSWEAWLGRYPTLLDTRPLLQHKSLHEVRALFEARIQAYSLSHLTVNTDAMTPEQAAKTVVAAFFDGS